MTKRIFLFQILWNVVNLAHGQDNNFSKRYLEVSVSLIATDIDEALRVSDSLLNVARTDEERAKAYMLSANIHKNMGEKLTAIQHATYADEIVKATLNPTWQAVTAGFLATAFREIGLLSAAQRYITQADRANNSMRKHPMYAITKINILHERAFQAFASDDFDTAESILVEAEKLAEFDGREDDRAKLIKATNHQLLGLSYLHRKNFLIAKQYYQSALTQVGKEENNLKPYIYLGLARVALGQSELPVAYRYLRQAEPYIETSQFEDLTIDVYQAFATYYWRTKDIESARRYYDLFTELKERDQKEDRAVINTLCKQIYETKESYKAKFKDALIAVLCLSALSIFLLLYIFFRDRRARGRSLKTDPIPNTVEVAADPEEEDKNDEVRSINMSKETEQRLLADIDKYEEKLYFLEKNISLSSMAKDLNTNQRYVSYIIRKYRGKDFYGYIQSCRIQFIVDRMKADPSLMDYKLAHLAEMSGFTSPSKFSIAFKAETGLPPSAYVHFKKKELRK